MIGRHIERRTLDRLTQVDGPELLAVLGRRRVGKTYLIRQNYKNHIVFDYTGTQDASKSNQLQKFAQQLQDYNKNNVSIATPKDWAEAFRQLTHYLQRLRKTKRKRVVFFDEFPWIAGHRSGFLNEFTYWWNNWATQQSITVVICGSAASWMIDKVVNNKGGLHNRITEQIHLQPFTLAEVGEYFYGINPAMDLYSILQLYMSIGGIPFYLKHLRQGESADQAIQRLCFNKDGILRTEFNNLYPALYDGHERHVAVVRALSSKWHGLTRQEIIDMTHLSDGGGITQILAELESASFIMAIQPFDKRKKDTLYRLVDEYSLFYLKFIEGQRSGKRDIWQLTSKNKNYKIWRGYAFENICIKHADGILQALGISGTATHVSSYLHRGDEDGTGVQIDMLLDRADRAINLCEMKFYNDEILLNKETNAMLRRRRTRFQELSKTKKSIYNTIITTYGIRENIYSSEQVDHVITMEDLFLIDRF